MPFTKTQAKIESGNAQVVWFLDIAKVIKLRRSRPAPRATKAQAQQVEVLIQELGRQRPEVGRRPLQPRTPATTTA